MASPEVHFERWPWGMGAVTDAPYQEETSGTRPPSDCTREPITVGREVVQRVGRHHFKEIAPGTFVPKRSRQPWDGV